MLTYKFCIATRMEIINVLVASDTLSSRFDASISRRAMGDVWMPNMSFRVKRMLTQSSFYL